MAWYSRTEWEVVALSRMRGEARGSVQCGCPGVTGSLSVPSCDMQEEHYNILC